MDNGMIDVLIVCLIVSLLMLLLFVPGGTYL